MRAGGLVRGGVRSLGVALSEEQSGGGILRRGDFRLSCPSGTCAKAAAAGVARVSGEVGKWPGTRTVIA